MSAFTTIRITREQAEEMVSEDIIKNKQNEVKKLLELICDDKLEQMVDKIGVKNLYNYIIVGSDYDEYN